MNGIGAHQSARKLSDEWLTPPDLLARLRTFDLDPCAPIIRPWDTAKEHYTVLDDGLSKEWHGVVWCNPPYGASTGRWLRKLAEHGNGIALIFARTETKMFFEEVWNRATALLFIKGRLFFFRPDGQVAKGNAGAPSVLVAYGEESAGTLERSGIDGKYLRLR